MTLLLTTTAAEVEEELLNRCIVLTVDEEREQTRAIHRRQRRGQTLEGRLAERLRERVVKVHQDAQRLLRPLEVVNPWADELTFPDDRPRMRRDHKKYLGLINAIALLHQYQRPVLKEAHDLEGERVEIEYVRGDAGGHRARQPHRRRGPRPLARRACAADAQAPAQARGDGEGGCRPR